MFPLGSVLLPTAVLPLHIFEERYQILLNDALEGDRTFGVVLISRGSEVGGGDVRTQIGTLARIEEYQRFDDGRAAVVSVGTERIEVTEWLPDDPFPRARVKVLPQAPVNPGDGDLLRAGQSALERLLTLAVEAERLERVPEITWASETSAAVWQLATVAPIGELDRQAILGTESVTTRIVRLNQLIEDLETDLRLMSDLG